MATDTFDAPSITCALVTITPSARTTNPDPMPALRRSPERAPLKYSKKSTGTCSTVSVCTVTTEGATRSTAVVIAVRRDAGIDWAGSAPGVAGGAGSVRDCAADEDGLAPSHPAARSATMTTSVGRGIFMERLREDAHRTPVGVCRPAGSRR